MITKLKLIGFLAIILSLFFMVGCSQTKDSLLVNNLMVEYTENPLGIDVETPRFGWQLNAPEGVRGYYQTAYQIVVKDPAGNIVWDSQKITSGDALAIGYQGSPLQATTKYDWTVTVWDSSDTPYSTTSWFETGLMNPSITAWDGAQWIGGSDDDLVFFSDYQLIFGLKYSIELEEGSDKASFVYGANDLRLMDKYKNIFQVESEKDESYIKLQLDISDVDGSSTGTAKLNVFRAGYAPEDNPEVPLKSFEVKTSVINNQNKYNSHEIDFQSAFGNISITLDGDASFFVQEPVAEADMGGFGGRGGSSGASVNLNPVGSGGNVIPFGMICDMGFAAEAGQKAKFTNVEVYNNRAPNNTLFKEDLSSNYTGIYKDVTIEDGAYVIDGGTDGTFIVTNPSKNSTPMLRTEFDAEGKNIADARLYVTARGIYEVFINGERVGNDYYNPGQTQYNKSHFYQTYDVTDLIDENENAIGAMMSEGWWSGLLSFGSIWNHFGDRQSLLAKLVITYKDGSEKTIVSNNSDWKYFNEGPIKYSSLDLGEIYDATSEALIEGWSSVGYNDSAWKDAVEVKLEGTAYLDPEVARDGSVTPFGYDDMMLIGQIGNNAGVYETLTAQSVEEVRDGVYVYNMGQNFVGVPKITFTNANAGDKIVLRFAEMLYPDMDEYGDNFGMIMTENYRAALCQDIYIAKDGAQVFQPKFTSRGYQYIEITGIDEPLPLDAVQGVAISSVLELTADYNTSNERVNQLWSNLTWSNVDNFLTIPTDCPQRNERMGWSGDINVFARTATYVSNSNQFLRRHMFAMRDVQRADGRFTDVAPIGGGFGGVLWGSAGITVPWETYLQYNDIELLREHYDAMKAYIDYLYTTINPETGVTFDGALGDWLGPQNNALGTPFLTTAYHIFDLEIMTKVAKLLGIVEDAEEFQKMYDERKYFFNSTFVNENHKTMGIVGGGGFGAPQQAPELKLADTQTSYAVGLALGAFSDENIPYVAESMAETIKRQNMGDDGVLRPEYSLMTGFIGTAWISKALSDQGYSDLAYKLIQNNQYPSWLYAIDQGATSIWERLNGYTVEDGFGGNNGMNSFNHYSFGAVGQWMMAYSLGIQRDEPGFKKFILQPEPDPTGEMTSAEGYYDSMYGRINSSWVNNDGNITYNFTVPANTTATLYLIASSADSITEGGVAASGAEGVTFVKYEDGRAVYEIQSGNYEFEAQL